MRKIAARQVHLDFHTSPLMPNVGSRFRKEEFQAALKEGNVNSITVFAKCHHGYCFYPTKVGTQHPTMEPGFDLTGAMVDAAHEIGVDAPIYITAGWSAKDAEEHPEWIMRDKNGAPSVTQVDLNAKLTDIRPDISWYNLCLNGEYADYIYEITREVVDRYDHIDGLFFDICSLEKACYCDHCVADMKAKGFDPDKEADARRYHVMQHVRFMETTRAILHRKFPEATIFFNGCAEIYGPEYHAPNTHFEMEDLPTTSASGGYNKMPPRASFMRRYGKDIVGMTGKFHTVWGEFGGYKNPNALKYEVLMMAMNGAQCSNGDQLPPSCEMDMEAYRIIGVAYRALEQIEPYAYPAVPTADVGIYLSGKAISDLGLHTMLLEIHIDFEVVSEGDDLSHFRLLILPDEVRLPDTEAERIRAFVEAGGSVLFGYHSGLKDGKFQLDAGMEYRSEPLFRRDYLFPKAFRLPFGNAPFLCYDGAVHTAVTDGEVLCQLYEPYFERTYEHYCSHMNTPFRDTPSDSPAMVKKGRVIYYAHPLCAMYDTEGSELYRHVIHCAIRLLYTPRYEVQLPSAGRTRLTWQEREKRYIFHASYVSPIQRGRVAVVEDIVPISDMPVSIRMAEPIRSVTMVPQGEALPFIQEKGVLRFTIPRVDCYQAVEIKTE